MANLMTTTPRVPELRAGDVLTRDEFERRYAARSRVTADDYLEGPPELVIEIAASSASYDLHQKLAVYRRNGVPEYLVHRVEDGEVDWFVMERGAYVRRQAAPRAG